MATWGELFLDSEISKPYFMALQRFIIEERQTYGRRVTPSSELELEAFHYTEPGNVKVVILGQDPNPNSSKATGLAFSLPKYTPVDEDWDRSILTIIEALRVDDVPFNHTGYGCLEEWATQGVLLLNAISTYRKAITGGNAHKGKGWETFTGNVIEFLSTNCKRLVFMLWGQEAQSFAHHIKNGQDHLILRGPHPAACGYNIPEYLEEFKGQHFFSTANNYLTQNGKPPINWEI